MEYQKLFKQSYIRKLAAALKQNKNTELYFEEDFKFDSNAILENKEIKVSKSLALILPLDGKDFDFENCKIIYEAYKNLTPTQATDMRIWNYLSHAKFWKYMKRKHPISAQPKNKLGNYILEHWFIANLSPSQYLSQDIALLWWAAHFTYDVARSNPYELTKEMFAIPSYANILLPSMENRNTNFIHALLEFVIENPELFRKNKEKRIAHLSKKTDFLGGYKVLPALAKNEIKEILEKYKDELRKI